MITGIKIHVLFLVFASIVIFTASCIPKIESSARGPEKSSMPFADFIKEARILYRMVSCSGTIPVFEGKKINPEIIRQHCEIFEPAMKKYALEYVGTMKTFLSGNIPYNHQPVVIYPFGGGDLLSALTTYPDAEEFYTLSLEHGGDISRTNALDDYQLYEGLKSLRNMSENLIALKSTPTGTVNTNETLKATQRGNFPFLISLSMLALSIHELEPVSLRYFEFTENGDIHYLNNKGILSKKDTPALPLLEEWTPPDFSIAYSNYELRFKPPGKSGPVRIYRHIAANLANSHFSPDTPVYKHLVKKGHISAMTKGALYLLWSDDFSNIRNYLIDSIDFMVSDSTGLSPLHIPSSLFHLINFGRFEGIINPPDSLRPHDSAVIELYKNQPYRSLPYRYGYPDKANNPHMIMIQRLAREQN